MKININILRNLMKFLLGGILLVVAVNGHHLKGDFKTERAHSTLVALETNS